MQAQSFLRSVYTRRIFANAVHGDANKSRVNLDERGFDFAFASLAFEGAIAVSGNRTSKHSAAKAKHPSRGRADLKRMHRMSEAEIERTSPSELANLPGDFWDAATVVVAQPKVSISLRVDHDVLGWFRDQGPRYQSRMNAVLRSYMERISARVPGERSRR